MNQMVSRAVRLRQGPCWGSTAFGVTGLGRILAPRPTCWMTLEKSRHLFVSHSLICQKGTKKKKKRWWRWGRAGGSVTAVLPPRGWVLPSEPRQQTLADACSVPSRAACRAGLLEEQPRPALEVLSPAGDSQSSGSPEGAQGLKEQRVGLWRPLVAMSNQEQTPASPPARGPALWQTWGWACGASSPGRVLVFPWQGVGGKGYRMRSSRASAELMTGFPLCSDSSFWAAPPGWMMETMMMPTTTATKVVHR